MFLSLVTFGCSSGSFFAEEIKIDKLSLARKVCPKSPRLCIQVLQPTICFVTVKGEKKSIKGTNTCDARNKLWKLVCHEYLNLTVEDVSATKCRRDGDGQN